MSDGNAAVALAGALREQIIERVKEQQQLVVVSALVAGATISFASSLLSSHPEVMALLCLLYVGISLAVLRHDQEITILAQHLLDPDAFGLHAEAQARWEVHKFSEMQGGRAKMISSSAQTAGNYGVPLLGVFATASATIISGANIMASVVLSIAAGFFCLFGFGAWDVFQRYRRLGLDAQKLLIAQKVIDGS
jgi:hypothetical protein